MKNQIKILKKSTFEISSENTDYMVECNLFEEIFNNKISEETAIYGIELNKFSSTNLLLESEIANGITSDFSFAQFIFKTLSDNKITPVCLYEIIDDLIGQQEQNNLIKQ